MYLLTKQIEPIILKEDKLVWIATDGRIYSPFFTSKFILGELNETNIIIGNSNKSFTYKQARVYLDDFYNLLPGVVSIENAFYGFTFLNYALVASGIKTYNVYDGIIPADSEYYEDNTGLCASNKIIVLCKNSKKFPK